MPFFNDLGFWNLLPNLEVFYNAHFVNFYTFSVYK